MKTTRLTQIAAAFLMIFAASHFARAEEAPQKDRWYIRANYDTLPCMTIQQTQALKAVRDDGVESLVKEADIFHEQTKSFFKKNKKFICPPILDRKPKSELVVPVGSSNSFEVIYVVYPWQMEVQSGTSKDEIWKTNFSNESGVGFGKTKKLKNPFTMVPLIPRDDKSQFLVHSMKLPGHEKELVRLCYPVSLKKKCNPYPATGEQQLSPED